MDITDYRNIPTIEIPAHASRKLTAAECEIERERCVRELARTNHRGDQRHLRREIRAWQKLAAERA